MAETARVILLAAIALLAAPPALWADCAADCAAAYRSCRGNPDTCLSDQGVCLSRCGGAAAVRHGAIAYSPKQEVYGYSFDFGSSGAAQRAAMRYCRERHRNADDCRVLVTFHDACGAIALGDHGAVGSAWGLTRGEASARALEACRVTGGKSCKADREICSGSGK